MKLNEVVMLINSLDNSEAHRMGKKMDKLTKQYGETIPQKKLLRLYRKCKNIEDTMRNIASKATKKGHLQR